MSVKRNNQDVKGIDRGVTPVRKMYRGDVFVFGASGSTQPCFEVVNTLSAATGNYVDVYNKCYEKWYKKNNLSQYEEYGIMPIVDSLSGVTYYVGKLVILSTDSHEYRWNGTTWVDLGECEYIPGEAEYFYKGGASTNGYFIFDMYFGEGYYADIDMFIDDTYTQDTGMFGPANNEGPLECSLYSNGFYFDFHAPQSTSGPSCYSGDYTKRLIKTNVSQLPKDGTRIIFRLQPTRVTIFNKETGVQLYQSGNLDTGYSWYNGLYHERFSLTSINKSNIHGIKVYNSNNEVVNDITFNKRLNASDNRVLYMYDSILDIEYENQNDNPISYTYIGSEPVLEPVVDYDTKVAPADNVHYDTLAELEMMECPWVGMVATIGQDNIRYEYTENGWTLITKYVTFDLNNGEWTGSTYTFTDYNTYMSVNPKNMEGYKCMKVEWYGYPEFYIDINSYSYGLGYQYTVAMNMDGDKPTSMPSYNSSGVKDSTYESGWVVGPVPTNISNYKPVYYPNDGEIHHAWIVYRQNNLSTNSPDNKGYIAVLDYDNIESLEYRTAQSEYYDAGSGVYYAKDYQWYSKDGTNFSQSNNWKQGEQLQTVDRVSQTEYLGSNGTYYQKVYKDVVTPDNVQRSTGYYVQGSQLPTTYVDSQTEYVGGNGNYYAKSYCYVTTPDNVSRSTGYYISGQELAVSGGTWAGETMIDHSDDKRYKLLPSIVTLLNGTTVQPSSFAELKGDYIEDVTYSVPSGYTQCDWIGTTRNSNEYTTKSQTSIPFTSYLTVLGSDDITIKSYIPYDQKVSSSYYVSTFGTSGLGLRCKANESTQNQMLIAWNGQNLVFGNSSNYIMYPLFDKVGELRFNAYGVEHKSYSANTATSLNSEIAAQGITLPLGTSNSYKNLYMFVRNDDMTNTYYVNSLCRLYGMIIKDYQTQTIKHNYVPSFNNNTNKLGLYDLIDNRFFPVNNDTNAGFASDDTIIEGTTSGSTDFYIGSNTTSISSTNSIKCHVVVTGTGINKFYAKLEDCNGSIKRIYSISSGFASKEGKKVLSIDKWTYPGYVESMERCFWDNTSIKRVDFRKLETNKLTNIVVLFGGCENLEQVNLEGFRNSKISNLQAMFSGCKKITNIDMSMFSYPLTSLLGTFQGCRSLTTLDIRNFDTTNTSTFSQIFANCTSLNKLYLGSGYFNSTIITAYDFSPLLSWTDTESLAMFVTAITAHDGTGKTVYLSSQTKAALTQAQKDAITAAGWTIS